MKRLRRQLSYANVMATIAVFVALGGGAYAATKITGQDVANRSLTGKDIKKRSVPLNRLKRRPARGRRGPAGPQGPKGETGPPGPVDPSRFLPSDGVTTVGVGPTNWTTAAAGNILTRNTVEANRVGFRAGAASGAQFLLLEPTLPINLAGRPVRVLAMTLCVNTADPDVILNGVFAGQYRGPLVAGFGQSPPVAEFADTTLADGSACRRYQFGQPFVLAPNDYVNVRLRLGFSDAGDVYVGASSFELDRSP